MPPNPPRGYLSIAQVSTMLGEDEWPTHRVRRWLRREGALVRKGRIYYTTRSRLKKAFKDIFEELFLHEF